MVIWPFPREGIDDAVWICASGEPGSVMAIGGHGDGCGCSSLLDRPWSVHREVSPLVNVLEIKP